MPATMLGEAAHSTLVDIQLVSATHQIQVGLPQPIPRRSIMDMDMQVLRTFSRDPPNT